MFYFHILSIKFVCTATELVIFSRYFILCTSMELDCGFSVVFESVNNTLMWSSCYVENFEGPYTITFIFSIEYLWKFTFRKHIAITLKKIDLPPVILCPRIVLRLVTDYQTASALGKSPVEKLEPNNTREEFCRDVWTPSSLRHCTYRGRFYGHYRLFTRFVWSAALYIQKNIMLVLYYVCCYYAEFSLSVNAEFY